MARLVCIIIFVLLLTPAAPAWNRGGHEQVARIAWARLDAATRARILNILKSHPAWGQWRQEVGLDDDGERIFARASTWADEIRKDPTLAAPGDVHPEWHYIDVAVSFDGTPLRATPSPNVLTALRDNQRVVSDPSSSPRDRAVALAWLIHLMGDVHQPLHCAERFSRELPAGDLGGNRWAVREEQGKTTNLHAFWDGLASGKTVDVVTPAERQIDFVAWVEEGTTLARRVAYDQGHVAGVAAPDPHHLPTPAVALDPGYIARARTAAQAQIARAGVRLAGVLKESVRP